VFKLIPSLHNPVIDHILKENNINPNGKCSADDVEIIKKGAEACK
jgi:hypothetical protein